MRIVISLLFFIVILSCNHVDGKLNDNLYTYFKVNLKEDDSTLIVDSVRLIKLDTITQSVVVFMKINALYDEMDMHEPKNQELEKKFNASLQIAKLYKGLDKVLYDNYVEEAKAAHSELNKLYTQDSLLLAEARSLEPILKTSDTLKPKYYEAICLVQYHKKDMSVKRDTLAAFLTLDKNIINKSDMSIK